jgi:hypothetical protein
MDKDTRNAIERATQRARKLLEEDFAAQLEGTFDVLRNGSVAAKSGPHLPPRQAFQRDTLVAAIAHKRAAGMSGPEAVDDYLRDSAFTTLNRFVALKMLEARELLQECITRGEQSSGFREFCGLAPGVALLPEGAGYRLYIESLFDELSTEVKILFDRRDSASVLWPKRATFEALLALLNATDLADVWGEDETIGWVYQFFNGGNERRAMREASHAPRNSRELAVRNQFFTPRYVVRFLVDNTLGRIWLEMRTGDTTLVDRCEYMVREPAENYAPRVKKDPRDLRVLDPACGSGHFLLYAFDLLLTIYEEAYRDVNGPTSQTTGKALAADYPSLDALRQALPALILAHNLHGVDIDARCAQIAQLALWMRAQRAFRESGIARPERPLIRRSNIVVAEPLVSDESTTQEFLARLGDAEVARVFTGLVDTLKLAGHMGLLLRLEDLVSRGSRKGTTGDLFAPPEARIRSALAQFAAMDGARASTQRHLFADDAAQGVGLLEMSEHRFDAVLMNPPFGEPTAEAQREIAEAFPEGVNDIYAAFVLRFSGMLAEHGRLGAITSRSFFVGRDLKAFRTRLLDGPAAPLQLVLDLGIGVLDAMVETAAYVVGTGPDDTVRFLDLRGATKADASITVALATGCWKENARGRLRALPHSQFLYDISDEDARSLVAGTRMEPSVGRVTKGLSTGDDARFVRLRWEQGHSAGARGGWELFSKGGEYGWFGGDVHLLVKRHAEGAELAAHAERTHGNVALSRQSSTYYGRAAVTWSRRSQKGFSARRLRPGVCFSDKSPVIIPAQQPERWIPVLLAALATDTYLGLIYAQSKFGSYETGSIKTLPVPDTPGRPDVLDIMNRLFNAIDEIDARDEACQLFVCPPPAGWNPTSDLRAVLGELDAFLRVHGQTFSRVVFDQTLDSASSRVRQLLSPLCWISYAMGVVLGRWAANIPAALAFPGPLDELSSHSVAESPLLQDPSPVSPGPEWLSDDEGTVTDVVAAVGSVLSQRAPHIGLVDSQLRETMRKALLTWHLTQYSKSARKAPVYWQLASASARYSAWIYYHRASKDSLFRLQNDYAVPKLRHEERRLELLRQELGASPTTTQRKDLAAQEGFVDELRMFVDDVRRVAPLWNPHSDDGVVINCAPLWRLVPQHASWQKELKATWDALCLGEFDWAHLAMHLWPERVVPQCATDRSLAIAHGLDSEFWVESENGKWSPRTTPLKSVDELVRERTSPAVKGALKSLLEASAGLGTGRARSDRAGASAAPHGGSR